MSLTPVDLPVKGHDASAKWLDARLLLDDHSLPHDWANSMARYAVRATIAWGPPVYTTHRLTSPRTNTGAATPTQVGLHSGRGRRKLTGEVAGVEDHAANSDWTVSGVDLLAGAVALFGHDGMGDLSFKGGNLREWTTDSAEN